MPLILYAVAGIVAGLLTATVISLYKYVLKTLSR